MNGVQIAFRPLWSILVLLLFSQFALADKVSVSIAKYDKKQHRLIVKTKYKGNAASVELYGGDGMRYGSQNAKKAVKFAIENVDSAPCWVRVKAGDAQALKKVAGADQSCRLEPVCRITAPASSLQATMGQTIKFAGEATLKDGGAGPLRYEWDFGGGAARLHTAEGETVFERDNSEYTVTFEVLDANKRRCADTLKVTVGTPPAGLPAKVGEQPAPAKGEALGKDTVVLPFNDMAMQSGYPTYATIYPWESINNLNAQVIRKGSVGDAKPVILTEAEVALRYSAASNPNDPVGGDSINSTSQNWPLDGSGHDHSAGGVQKTEGFWLHGEHASAVNGAIWWLIFADSIYNGDYYETIYPPDEGLRSRHNITEVTDEYGFEAHAVGEGRHMPGAASPYAANDPQVVSAFLSDLGQFTAEALPLSHIDDRGRINSFPLMRVEAADKASGKVLARADAVVSQAADMSCRDCHLKGGIGAEIGVERKGSDFNFHMPDAQLPTIYEPAGNDIIALEKAALSNIGALHTWYNMYPWWQKWGDDASNPDNGIDNGMQGGHTGFACYAHHNSAVAAEFNVQQPFFISPSDYSPGGDYPPYSKSMHGFHGRLQQDAQGKLIRDENGNALLWGEPGNQNPPTLAVGSNPNTVFPVGGDRPMEDNCLHCHAGKREQLYRDHHYTVGLKCADCHGDMLAVSQLLAKPDGSHRQEWLDQPNCGSCHSGNGSEAVAKRAYDPKDPSAAPLAPKSERFAVQAATVQIRTGTWADGKMPLKDYTSTAFRHSRDTHGKVACAACHGPGHALWPNRDPNANDNQTAIQLQGYSGTIMECRVCHTDDAFASGKADKNGDGILAGPHGMHPVGDVNWFAATDANRNLKAGWHGEFSKKPGKSGEDQCAACHGVDHKGTRLSRAATDREYPDPKTGKVWDRRKKGEIVGCDLCHSLEMSFQGSPGAK